MNQTKGVLVPPAYQIFLKVRPPLLFSLSNMGLTLKKEMATHSSIPVWEIPWTEEPDGLQSMRGRGEGGHKRVGQTERLDNIISSIITPAPLRSLGIRSQRLGTLGLLSLYC